MIEHDCQQALTHLFTIFTNKQDYKDGAAKEMIINLSNMVSANEPELSKEIRQRLASSSN